MAIMFDELEDISHLHTYNECFIYYSIHLLFYQSAS